MVTRHILMAMDMDRGQDRAHPMSSLAIHPMGETPMPMGSESQFSHGPNQLRRVDSSHSSDYQDKDDQATRRINKDTKVQTVTR